MSLRAPINLPILPNVRIASPCHMKWEDMAGTDRVRHCSQCDFNVFNLSDMTTTQAETLIKSAQGRLCIAYYQRADGTIMTRDCPVGLAAARAALVRTCTRISAIASALFAFIVVGRSSNDATGASALSSREPFASIAAILNPRPAPLRMVAGEMYIPPPKTTPPVTPNLQLSTPPTAD